jgi:hypothetical protein
MTDLIAYLAVVYKSRGDALQEAWWRIMEQDAQIEYYEKMMKKLETQIDELEGIILETFQNEE